MTLDPILNAPMAVQIHVFTVVPAFMLGAWMLMARKGTRIHKLLGRVWVALMAVTALSSFFIHEIRMIGGFSPIHLLSILTLFSCGFIIWTARQRRFSAHRKTVLALYWGGIGLAGAFTIVPGRIMNQAIFGGAANVWPVVIGLAALCVGVPVVLRRDKPLAGRKGAAAAVALAVSPLVLLASGDHAQAAAGAADIATRAPLWVWPLLAALLFLGWTRSRPRTVSKARVLILPIVLAGMGIGSFFSNGGTAIAASFLLLGLAAGAATGQVLARREGALLDEAGMVHLKGEWISMGLILVIFASRFAAGAAQGVDPSLHHSLAIAIPLALVSGFSVGLTGMRALIQTGIRA